MNLVSSSPGPRPYKFAGLYIDGEWRPGSSGQPINNIGPWSERVIGTLIGADVCDVDVAYAAAQSNQRVWAQVPPRDRADVLHRAAGLMAERRREIENWLVEETGSTRRSAKIEWSAACYTFHTAAALPFRFAEPLQFQDFQASENYLMRRPVGVAGLKSPHFGALYHSAGGVTAALALGNAVVLQASELTPVCGGLMLARVLEEAGLPPGVLNVVVGTENDILNALVTHSIPKVISFCGEASLGRQVQVMMAAGAGLKSVILDFHRHASLIITDDVDLDWAVKMVVKAAFGDNRSIGIALNRLIVASTIYDRFVDRFVDLCKSLKTDDPEDAETAYGPLISRRHLDDLTALVADACAEGAQLRLGGVPKGLRLPPQVMDRVTPAMAIARRPPAGPAALIFCARDDDESVCIANAADQEQNCVVLCCDNGRAMAIAKRLDAQRTDINDFPACEAHQWPFDSRTDRKSGKTCDQKMIEAFTTEHWIVVQTAMDEPAPTL
jgi:aldehyde dehydrogenase (NAD+)